jgi:CubicO group peptidase (beta-lactamase class C family)
VSAPSELAPALERSLRSRQAERLPSLAAAVVREGVVVWSDAVGLADCEGGLAASPETQYRIGSITKSLTAVTVMALREEGRLDLDDPLEAHLPGNAHGSLSIRRMLSHLSGLQREAGEMFVSGRAPSSEELLAALDHYEQVLPSARAHHYSNLAYALLGEVVARASGVPYARLVEERVLGPLGLERTTWSPRPPFAQGYLVEEYAGTVVREPHIELGAVAPMGQLWSTVGDLCGLASFLAGDGGGILEPASLEQMWTLQSVVDPERWSVGYGLGLELSARDGRVFGGHGGAMPGFLAGVHVHRESGVGAAVLANAGTRLASRELCLELASTTIERWPAAIPPWQPEREPPAEVRAILGRWWSEGNEFVFSWRAGKLTAALPGSPPWVHPSVFAPLGDGSFRVVEGRERGERLRPVEGGMVFGGYLFTRDQTRSPG